MKRYLALITLALGMSLQAQTPCNPDETDTCTGREAYDFYRKAPVQKEVKKEVVDSNRATTPPDTFAGRLHNSYEDYLNLLNFAITDVQETEDGKALVLRFNPWREGRNLFGLSLTAREPQIAESISEAIPEPVRSTTIAALDKQLGDFDDLTWSASYSWGTPVCPTTWSKEDGRCFGRTPKSYSNLVATLLTAAPGVDVDQEIAIGIRIAGFHTGQGDRFRKTLAESSDPAGLKEELRNLAKLDVAGRESLMAFYTANHLDLRPTLIDNQPQVSGTVSYRTPGDFGGPDGGTASVELHFGRNNINSLRKVCNGIADAGVRTCLQRQLNAYADGGLLTDKFVFTASYKWSEDFDMTSLLVGDEPVTGFLPVAVDSTSELNVKAQGGRELTTNVGGRRMRADLAFEGIRVMQGEEVKQNRWIGALTLSVPLGDNMTIPLTVRYANKAEFLGDVNDRLGAHVGISYRLPELFGGN